MSKNSVLGTRRYFKYYSHHSTESSAEFAAHASTLNSPRSSEGHGNGGPHVHVVPTHEDGNHVQRHSDDIIVTPFAQVLHTLLNARDNVVRLTNSPSANPLVSTLSTSTSIPIPIDTHESSTNAHGLTNKDLSKYGAGGAQEEHLSGDFYRDLANKTVEDLDWCLKQLEAIQTTRSVSDMASSKFKRLLTKELNTMAGINRSSNQVSKYIESTFLDDREAEMSRSEDMYDPAYVAANTTMNDKINSSNLSAINECFTCDKENNLNHELGASILESPDLNSMIPSGAKPTMTKVPIKVSQINSNHLSGALPRFGVTTPHEVELRERIDADLDRWGMDIFKLHQLSEHRPLTAISYAIFEQRGFMKKFNIPSKILVKYFINVEDHYRSDIPYHNAMHATDVLQSTHVLLNAASLSAVLSDLDKLSCIFACAIHDVNHPGVTNQFLVNSKNELAIMYNDESVLENHHLAVAFRLLQESDSDIFAGLSSRDHKTLRKMVIDMVLATDMSKHMSLLADLKTIVETKKVQGKSLLQLETYADKIKILQNLVHCADLSNPAKPLPLYRVWTDRIMEEFFCQGDLEKTLGLEISPMCDRSSANIAASQVTFIDYIAHPLWEAWTELVHPDAEDILSILENNRDWYNEQLHLASNASREATDSDGKECTEHDSTT